MHKHSTKTERFLHLLPLFVVGAMASFSFIAMAFASDMSSERVVELINQERASHNLAPLSVNENLSRAATRKAEDMIEHDYFAHTSPEGRTPWQWVKEAGYEYKTAGENLAINFVDAEQEHTAWMKSETHRANILNPEYEEVGIAVVKGSVTGEDTLVTVSLFGKPAVAVGEGTTLPAEKVAIVKGAETAAAPVSSPRSLDILSVVTLSLLILALLGGPLAFLYQAFRAYQSVSSLSKAGPLAGTAS